MAYTIEDIREMVMDVVGEDSANPTYFTSSNLDELDEWIQDGFEEVCLVTGQYCEEVVVPLFANRAWYRVDPGKSGELLWIKHLRVWPEGYELGGTDPLQLSREDYNWMTRTGTPRLFFPVGLNLIRVVPFPSTEGQSLEGTVVCLPPSLVSAAIDTVIDLEDDLIRPVVDYAAGMLLLASRRFEKAAAVLTSYTRNLNLADIKLSSLLGRALKMKGVGEESVS